MKATARQIEVLQNQLKWAVRIGDYLGAMWLRERLYRAMAS